MADGTTSGRILPGDPGKSSAEFSVTVVRSSNIELTEEGVRATMERILNTPRHPRPEEVDVAEELRAAAQATLDALDQGEPLHDAHQRFLARMAAIREESSRPAYPCQCGATLLEAGWRGRARVLCEACGIEWAVDAPESGGYSRWALTTKEPSSWHDAADDRPDEVPEGEQLFQATMETLGGSTTNVHGPLRFEISDGVIPPWIRLLCHGRETVLALRPDASIALWVQTAALREVQHQRRRAGPGVHRDEGIGAFDGDDDDEDWVDYEQLTYEPLSQQHPELATIAIERYTQIFTRLGHIDPGHSAEVRTSLSIDASTGEPPPVLRATSHITGGTRWQEEWDGTLLEMLEFVEDLAENHAHWIHTERHLTGSTPFDLDSEGDE